MLRTRITTLAGWGWGGGGGGDIFFFFSKKKTFLVLPYNEDYLIEKCHTWDISSM